MLTVISPACSEVQSTHSRPSAIYLPGWLNMSQQRQIAETFHEWSTGPLPIRATSLPGGHQMSRQAKSSESAACSSPRYRTGWSRSRRPWWRRSGRP